MKRRHLWTAALLVSILSCGLSAAEAPAGESVGDDDSSGDSATGSESEATTELFERVRVTGTPDKIRTIPGAVTYLDAERLAQQEYSDVHRILSQVPGVNITEEDGYGLRPNIGMRGSGSERSAKITTMEDGVLIAPAPYAAPSAYYFPTAGRMEGIEVRKGSSSIQHGPFTNGGVLNFVSSSIPSSFGGSLSLGLGDESTLRGKFKIGDSGQRFGWLFETYQFDTAGFKELDAGGDTGFDLQDYLLKLRFTSRPEAARFQALEIKAGKTEQFGNETYLGLTDADFAATPFRRYAASRQDNIDTDHEQIQARYLLRPSSTLDFTATVYRNDFFRNWRKLQSVSGESLNDVLSDPVGFSAEMAILRGDLAVNSADDALAVRNNRRDYYSQGIHAVLGIKPGGRGSTHEIEVGVRYHKDEEDRFQEEDDFRMTSTGQMELTRNGLPGSQANRVSSGESLALFVKDTIRSGNWTITPGARFETIRLERRDFVDAARSAVVPRPINRLDEVIPGVGVAYELRRGSTLFGGIHRGFAPPGPSATNADAEDSTNFEFGYRRGGAGLTAEVTGFYNDYSNMLGACTVSSGCSTASVGDVFDAGDVKVHGVEAGLSYDLARRQSSRFSAPLNVSYTYTHGEFRNSFQSEYDPWGEVIAGDKLPYVPEHQISVGFGLNHRKWSAHTNLLFVDEMRTIAGQGPISAGESTAAHLVVDFSGSYRLSGKVRAFAQVRNLTNETYVAARRPAGLRPGIDRTVIVGAAYDF